jgi:CBS domain-containing protein/sporulation protein YlmC with PRC-barrel domain
MDTGKIEQTMKASYFLSDIIGTKVYIHGKKIGKLSDIIIREHDKLPEVTHLIIGRPFGHKSLLVPWDRVVEIDRRIIIEIGSIEKYEGEPSESQVLLRDHILDKKVIDLEGQEIDIVYDVKLTFYNNRLYLTDVDFSKYGLLKRIGLKPLANFIYHLADVLKKETLSWSYVQPLPEHLGSFKGNVRLNVLKEKLPEIHPVDLADILEELSEEQRLAIFNELDTEHASDTLEEIEPRVQRSLIAALGKERVAELLNEMTPAQAADVLAVLPTAEADEIMELMDKTDTQKIEGILDKQDTSIADLTTTHFIKFSPDIVVRNVVEEFRQIAVDKDFVTYIYVVDAGDKLVGVVNLQELLQAKLEDKLQDIMTTQVISLNQDDDLNKAAETFVRYGFRALPVTDEEDVIVGVVPYRDIMNLEHKFI